MKLNWEVSREEFRIIRCIASRAMLEIPEQVSGPLDLEMDLIAVHNHNGGLELERLYHAPGADFIHDIVGIRQHMNRETGLLGDHFIPRYTANDRTKIGAA